MPQGNPSDKKGGKGKGFYPPKKGNSFGEKHPHLITEWQTEDFSPFDIGAGSNLKVEWKCQVCEHEWEGQIANRSQGKGCPFCGGNVVHSDGRNSLETMAPHLVPEWDEPNSSPSEYRHGSGKKVGWKCQTCNHKWNAVIASRTKMNRGCPACVGQAVHNDLRNSLGTLRPEIAKDWNHPNKSAHEFTERSGKKVPWKCHVCDHQWEALISNRAKGAGCPYCSSNSLHSDGRNALSVTHPELCEELDDENHNGDSITAGYDKKVRWKCRDCHDLWDAKVFERAHTGTGCPVCNGIQVHSSGRNSLAAEHPELILEWDDERIDPTQVRSSSNKKVRWKCIKCKKTWKTGITNRTKKNPTGCPSCASTGFDPNSEGFYYAMEIIGPSGTWWWKGGITSDVEKRRYQIESGLKSMNMDLEVKVRDCITFERGKYARELENTLLSIDAIRANTIEKFDGSRELFSENPITYARQNGLIHHQKLVQSTIDMWQS